jgi:hypothetical protein
MASEFIPDPNQVKKCIDEDARTDAITTAASFAVVNKELGGPLGEVLVNKGLNLNSLGDKIVELINARKTYTILVPIYNEEGKRIGANPQQVEVPDYNIQSRVLALVIRATGLETALKIDHSGTIDLVHSAKAPESLAVLRQKEAELRNPILDAEVIEDV